MTGKRYWALSRLTVMLAVTGALVTTLAAPAAAHGGGGADATNFRSRVLDVVEDLAGRGEGGRSIGGLGRVSWRIVAGDALLAVENGTDQELVVPGNDGEPYLRIGPDGVFENANSPATYLNNDRFAETPVPDKCQRDRGAGLGSRQRRRRLRLARPSHPLDVARAPTAGRDESW